MNNFDKEKFSKLLLKAKGDRSINQYALHSDVSAAHISRLLRKILKTPPSPEIIKKLSNKAYNDVSYFDLMQAAGHVDIVLDKENNTLEESIKELTPYLHSYLDEIVDKSNPHEYFVKIKNLIYNKSLKFNKIDKEYLIKVDDFVYLVYRKAISLSWTTDKLEDHKWYCEQEKNSSHKINVELFEYRENIAKIELHYCKQLLLIIAEQYLITEQNIIIYINIIFALFSCERNWLEKLSILKNFFEEYKQIDINLLSDDEILKTLSSLYSEIHILDFGHEMDINLYPNNMIKLLKDEYEKKINENTSKSLKEKSESLAEKFLDMLIDAGEIKTKEDLTSGKALKILGKIFNELEEDTEK